MFYSWITLHYALTVPLFLTVDFYSASEAAAYVPTPKPPGVLFTKQSQAIMYNFKPDPVQRMLDFDYMCK